MANANDRLSEPSDRNERSDQTDQNDRNVVDRKAVNGVRVVAIVTHANGTVTGGIAIATAVIVTVVVVRAPGRDLDGKH